MMPNDVTIKSGDSLLFIKTSLWADVVHRMAELDAPVLTQLRLFCEDIGCVQFMFWEGKIALFIRDQPDGSKKVWYETVHRPPDVGIFGIH